MAKKRIDTLLVEKGLASSREKAKRMILAGEVFIKSNCIDKAGMMVAEESNISVKKRSVGFVSRGGLKLEKALNTVKIDVKEKIFLDIGASTGGFTDCLLKRGAQKVYAIDVGYGQLAWELRNNPQVVNMERTNIRYVTPEDIKDICDGAVVDVSFISLTKVLPAVIPLLKDDAKLVTLIKPQFEAGRENVGKNGVIRDEKIHKVVIKNVIGQVGKLGLKVEFIDFSPIKGPKGNIEFLACWSKVEAYDDYQLTEELVWKIDQLVEKAHLSL